MVEEQWRGEDWEPEAAQVRGCTLVSTALPVVGELTWRVLASDRTLTLKFGCRLLLAGQKPVSA